MNDTPRLILCAIGGILALLVAYTLRDYLVVGLASVGAVFLHKLATESNDRNRRR